MSLQPFLQSEITLDLVCSLMYLLFKLESLFHEGSTLHLPCSLLPSQSWRQWPRCTFFPLWPHLARLSSKSVRGPTVWDAGNQTWVGGMQSMLNCTVLSLWSQKIQIVLKTWIKGQVMELTKCPQSLQKSEIMQQIVQTERWYLQDNPHWFV